MADDSIFSQLAVTVTRLQCKITQLENKCKSQTSYLTELNSEYEKEKEIARSLNENVEDLLSTEKLLKENIDSISKSNSAAEESYFDLRNQVALAVAKTKQLKDDQDKTLEKYSARWEKYLEIYNNFPLAKEKNQLRSALRGKYIQINLLKFKILESRRKIYLLQHIKEKKDQVYVIKMAELYTKYNNEVKKRNQFLLKIRQTESEIEQGIAEKASLLKITGSKENESKIRAGSFAWSSDSFKKPWNEKEPGKDLSTMFSLQKLKIPELKFSPPPPLNLYNWNTRRTVEKVQLQKNKCTEKTSNPTEKQKDSVKHKFLENAQTELNVMHPNAKNDTPVNSLNKTYISSSLTEKCFSADEKQKHLQENKTRDLVKQNFQQDLQHLEKRTVKATEFKLNKVNLPQTHARGNDLSFHKLKSNIPLKQSELSTYQVENSSIIPVIEIHTGPSNTSTQLIDINTPLKSLVNKANLKRLCQSNNHSDTSTFETMKTKQFQDNLLSTSVTNCEQKQNVNFQKNRDKENNTILHKISTNNDEPITNCKMQKLNPGSRQPENNKQQSQNDLQLKYNEAPNPEDNEIEGETIGKVQSQPDVVPTGSQESRNDCCSPEYLTPSALDEAGREVYMKIVQESPGYEYEPESIMYHVASDHDFTVGSETGEKSHYFNHPASQEKCKDDYPHSTTYRPQFSSYSLTPPNGITRLPESSYQIGKESSTNYLLSPPGGSFGEENFIQSKLNNRPLFGPKATEDTNSKHENKKSEGFSFSFSGNANKSSVFNLFD